MSAQLPPRPWPSTAPPQYPGIAPTPPRRRLGTWLGVGGVVLATVASLGLAGVARPKPLYPDVPAAQYVAPTGQRNFLRGDDGTVVVETSHLPGGQGWAERTQTGWASAVGLEATDLQSWHWVTETEITEKTANLTFYHLGDQGLRIFTGGNSAQFEYAAIPAIIELPPDPQPGTTWTQESTLHVPAAGITEPFTRTASIAASPMGEGCITVTYDDMVGDEPSTADVTRCPGRGIVAWNGATITTDPLTWADKALVTTNTHLDFSALTPLANSVKNGSIDLLPSINSAPVTLGDGFVYTNQLNSNLTFVRPSLVGSTDLGMALSWVRRPGPTTLALLGTGDLVVAATSDRQLVAYDTDGLVRWQVGTADIAGLPPVTLDENTLVLLTLDGFLTAHDLRTGEQKWRTAAPVGEMALSVVQVDGRPMTVLAAGADVHLYDGDDQYLSVTMLDEVTSVVHTPSGLVVADAGGLVTLIDMNGRAHWSTWTDGCTQLTVIGETVYCPQEDNVLAFAAATGRQVFTRPLQAQMLSSDGTRLAVLTRDTITVLNTAGDVQYVLPMVRREGVSSWMMHGSENVYVITNLSELFRWGRP